MRNDAAESPQGRHDRVPGMRMTCRELFERLSEYVDGELPEELRRQICDHMRNCDPCVAFANTLKTTAGLCHRLPAQSLPPEVAASLQAFLAAHLPGKE